MCLLDHKGIFATIFVSLKFMSAMELWSMEFPQPSCKIMMPPGGEDVLILRT